MRGRGLSVGWMLAVSRWQCGLLGLRRRGPRNELTRVFRHGEVKGTVTRSEAAAWVVGARSPADGSPVLLGPPRGEEPHGPLQRGAGVGRFDPFLECLARGGGYEGHRAQQDWLRRL